MLILLRHLNGANIYNVDLTGVYNGDFTYANNKPPKREPEPEGIKLENGSYQIQWNSNVCDWELLTYNILVDGNKLSFKDETYVYNSNKKKKK